MKKKSKYSRGRPKKYQGLPPYCTVFRGWVIYRPLDPQTGKRVSKYTRVALETAPMSDIWKKYEELANNETKNFEWLAGEYLKSPQFEEKSDNTRDDYKGHYRRICNHPTSVGPMGKIPLDKWSPGLVRKYLDVRTAKVTGNREVAFMSLVFSWGFEREMVKDNPVKGVRRNKEKSRTHYADDADYHYFLEFVKREGARMPYLWVVMELCYLCRLRKIEALTMTKDKISEKGILCERRKGSKDNIVKWSPRLRAAVAGCFHPASIYVVSNSKGEGIGVKAFNSAWGRMQRACVKAAKNEGVEYTRFTLHDLKAKGMTDYEGPEREKSAGHKTASMANVYIRKPDETDATR